MCRQGKLKFFYGCMGGGKSLHLLATAHNFQEHKIPFLILKSTIDTRDGENIIHSRALGDRECVGISPENDVYDIVAKYLDISAFSQERIKWILVDEAQFLTEEQDKEI